MTVPSLVIVPLLLVTWAQAADPRQKIFFKKCRTTWDFMGGFYLTD